MKITMAFVTSIRENLLLNRFIRSHWPHHYIEKIHLATLIRNGHVCVVCEYCVQRNYWTYRSEEQKFWAFTQTQTQIEQPQEIANEENFPIVSNPDFFRRNLNN